MKLGTVYLDMRLGRILINGMWWKPGKDGADIDMDALGALRERGRHDVLRRMWLTIAGVTFEVERLVVMDRWVPQ